MLAGKLLKCKDFFFLVKIASSLLKNKANLCLKIQMKLLLRWGSKEGIYMLWNEWHACANSRRPDISKVSDRAVYTAFFALQIQRFLPWQSLKDPWLGWGGGRGKRKNEQSDCMCLISFYLFILFYFPQNCLIVHRILVLFELVLFF